MDDNVRDVAIALITVAGGVIVGILVSRMTANSARSIERGRTKRELYGAFIHACDEIRDAVHGVVLDGNPGDEGWADQIGIGQRLLTEIKIVAPDMRVVAGATWDAIAALMKGVIRMDASTPGPDGGALIPIDRSKHAELDQAYRLASIKFIDAAARDRDIR